MSIAAFELGKKYERKVQTLLETHSAGQVFRNVWIGHMEFDAVVEDYPVLTFVEIKRYRSDFNVSRVRQAVMALREHCTCIVNSTRQYNEVWIPRGKWNVENGKVSRFELLLNKLDIKLIDGWRFRMVLIVPDKVYARVITALRGHFMKFAKTYPRNVVEMDGIPLVVIRDGAISSTF